MTRFGMFLAVVLMAASTSRAGELDSEYGRKDPASSSPAKAVLPLTMSEPLGHWAMSELDAEVPAQSFRGGGFGGGFGRFGGFGGGFGRFGGFGGGFGRFGGFGGFGGGFGRFGGFGGFGRPLFFGNRGFGFGGFGFPFFPGFGGFGGFGLGGFGGFGLGGFGGYGLGGFGGFGPGFVPVGYGFGGCW